jgi:hypothetical protein
MEQRFHHDRGFVSILRLQARCAMAMEQLRRRDTAKVSPAVWAMNAKSFGMAARFVMRSQNPEKSAGLFELSADAAIKAMAACVKICTDRCAEYRQVGIDPQVAVTIAPCIEYARATLAEWKGRKAQGSA